MGDLTPGSSPVSAKSHNFLENGAFSFPGDDPNKAIFYCTETVFSVLDMGFPGAVGLAAGKGYPVFVSPNSGLCAAPSPEETDEKFSIAYVCS